MSNKPGGVSTGAGRRPARTLRKQNIGPLGVAFMLYCLVSAGAFGIEEMIPSAGPGMTLALLCVLPLVWAHPISSLVAECNAVLPKEGGIYVWAKEAFGEFWGFQAGWWTAISTYVSSGAYVALTAGYVTQILPLGDTGAMVVKLGMIGLFTIVNLVGLKEVEWVSSVLSVLIVAVFALIAVLGFSHWQTDPVYPFTPDGDVLGGFSEGIGIAIWMYCGYECIATMSGEIEDARAVPRGLKIALPLVALSYILPTLAALGSLPAGSWADWGIDGGLDASAVGYASVLTATFGDAGRIAFLAIAVVSQCAIYNTYMASGSRSFFVLADDCLFPKSVAKLGKSGRSPYIGVLLISLSSIVFAQFEFAVLVDMEIVFILATYVILSATVVRLRAKHPVEKRREQGLYVIGFGRAGLAYCTVLPALISVFALFTNGVGYVAYAAAALSTGPAFYVLFKRLYGGLASIDPAAHPIDTRTGLAEGDGRRIASFFLGVAVMLLAAWAFNLVAG